MERNVKNKVSEKGKHSIDKETVSKENEKEIKEQNDETEKTNVGKDKTDEIIEIKKQNETLKIRLDETDDRLKRVAAEFDNYKKRSAKEKEGMYDSLMGDVVSKFLPVIDNLEKAVSSKTEDENYKQGVELVLKQFKDVLTSNGIKEIETIGKTFDPELHEAVSLVQDENLGEKEIKEEYRKGYMIGDKVIRHSMVVVAN